MATDAHGLELIQPLVFLGSAVLAVPLFARLGLGGVVGYLAAGVVIGPAALGLIDDPASVLGFSELGIVMLLFLIGLELKPARLWAMRRDILMLGGSQLLACGLLLFLVATAFGLGWKAAVIAGLGLALSSTAFAVPLMEARGELAAPYGRRAFAILLLQDLAIVPLLALVALLAPSAGGPGGSVGGAVLMVTAIAFVVFAGRFLLNPLFKILAANGGQDVMTAAALLVVLGAAAIMAAAGLSMAMGAFLAGVLLAESNFRHELEADIEPFRGLLLGLFFIAVGMSIDLRVVAESLVVIAIGVGILIVVKTFVIAVLARMSGSSLEDSLRIGGLLSQGGEFAFVLFASGSASGLLTPAQAATLVAIVTISLILTPAAFAAARRLGQPRAQVEPEESFADAGGSALVIGFGRFGQIVAQMLLEKGLSVVVIDRNVGAIEAAERYGMKVYYGDGSRLDVLRAAGAGERRIIAVCIDDPDGASRIVSICGERFSSVPLAARARDREQALALVEKDVPVVVRETFESAITLGREVLAILGVEPDERSDIERAFRQRDAERFARQRVEGALAGRDLVRTSAAAEGE